LSVDLSIVGGFAGRIPPEPFSDSESRRKRVGPSGAEELRAAKVALVKLSIVSVRRGVVVLD
jgi:hypothetical protein